MINKRNRDAPRSNHCVGTKSFARIIHDKILEENTANEDEIDKIELFHETHYSKKKNQWLDERSKEIYERLVALRESSSLSVEEIFEQVLPEKSACFRGMGVVPKPKRSRASQEAATLRKELEEFKARDKEMDAFYLEAKKTNQELATRLADMEKKFSMLLEMQQNDV